jgi:hypothetical protein
MPSIDLARLRKQALRLADFFFVPDEFVRHLNATLDKYVDYTIRDRHSPARGRKLPSQRTPPVVMQQIEQQLTPLASAEENADAALALADRLWDDAGLQTRSLAAFLLGHIPPEEAPLVARLTAWTSQVDDPELRSRLVDASLVRMRKEAPDVFLHMVGEWLRPERKQLWANALRASIHAVNDPSFRNFPSLMQVLEPVVKAAPTQIQLDLEELVLALHNVSPMETAFFVKQVLNSSDDPKTFLTFRRMLPAFPPELRDEIKEIVRAK